MSKNIKPVPYYTLKDRPEHTALAGELRDCFRSVVKRHLPMHHLNAFKQGEIPAFVRTHKAEYPYFVRTDIQIIAAQRQTNHYLSALMQI